MTTFYRRLPKFDYVAPGSIEEAWKLMAGERGVDYDLFAGGTDVLPKLKRRQAPAPKVLIDLKRIGGLDEIHYDDRRGLVIGALATVHAVTRSPLIRERFPVLAMAAERIAATQIQHRATVVGNLCNAAPSADTASALLALEAEVRCASAAGERTLALRDFFRGPLQNALGAGEIVTEILVPRESAGAKSAYLKLCPRGRMDLAVVGVAAVLFARDGLCQDVRIGLGAVAPTPIRAAKAESALRGAELTEANIARAASAAVDESRPRDSIRGSAAYRRAMVGILVARAIDQCLGRSCACQ